MGTEIQFQYIITKISCLLYSVNCSILPSTVQTKTLQATEAFWAVARENIVNATNVEKKYFARYFVSDLATKLLIKKNKNIPNPVIPHTPSAP